MIEVKNLKKHFILLTDEYLESLEMALKKKNIPKELREKLKQEHQQAKELKNLLS